ncbi:hypothetical protein SAMN05444166_2798 [Singulisphaera sp. GP187]|uniref:hypothetical protein n=1 Tax=Singulisphaera sp. GP187 TaxID=1882752 RepID=UPI000929746B|nr:hypothetical protein [Singulisphaera sp. GP187]SIO16847.1 hypothetical protein SAMN05444166_2798 [Singulisphaera sp. GP187]
MICAGLGVPDYLIKRWEAYSPNDAQRTVWDIAVFEAYLRPKLATETQVVQDGVTIHVWTAVDIPGMKADYWAATKSE